MDVEYLKKMKTSGAESLAKLRDYFIRNYKFKVGDKHTYRLNKSLQMSDIADLEDITLLNRSVHTEHTRRLNNLFIHEYNVTRKKVVAKAVRAAKSHLKIKIPTDDDVNKNIKLLTIIHSVTAVNAEDALLECIKLKDEIRLIVEKSRVRVIGSIEASVEPVNKKQQQQDLKLKIDNKSFKFQSLKKLAIKSGLQDAFYETDVCLFSIHLHAVVFSTTSLAIEDFEAKLIQNQSWRIVNNSQQISIKSLYEDRTIQDNFRNLANYFTKCTSTLSGSCNDNACYKYKHEALLLEDLIAKDATRNKPATRPADDDEDEDWLLEDNEWKYSIDDSIGLSAHEIAELAKLSNLLMNLDDNYLQNGYLINF